MNVDMTALLIFLGIGLVALANLEAIVIGPSARWHRVLEWLAG